MSSSMCHEEWASMKGVEGETMHSIHTARPSLSDYFQDITYVDQLMHFCLAAYCIVVLIRLLRASEMKFHICDANLIDAVCQISTLSLFFASFRILRKENFNIQIPITNLLLTLLATITTFTFGISVGRSWGLAEATLNGGEENAAPFSKSHKRTIRPKNTSHNARLVAHSHGSSDDSSTVKNRLESKKKAKHWNDSIGQSPLSHHPSDEAKQTKKDMTEEIYDTVKSAKERLFSSLDLMLATGKSAPSAQNTNDWKLVRTGQCSHIWLAKRSKLVSSVHNGDDISTHRKNNCIVIKASCFSSMSVTDVVLFLRDNNITTGLECITKQNFPIKSLKNQRIFVNQFQVGSTLTTSKREFVVASHWMEIPETRSVVVCTQSMPEDFSPKIKGGTRGTVLCCGFVVIPAASAPATSRARDQPKFRSENSEDVDIRQLINGGNASGQVAESGCQILYFADIDFGGSSGMAMRRAVAAKSDSIVNYLHSLMDKLHHKIPSLLLHDSLSCAELSWDTTNDASDHPHAPSVLDCVFRDTKEPGPGGLSVEQSMELRNLSLTTSVELKNLYCNAIGLPTYSAKAPFQHIRHDSDSEVASSRVRDHINSSSGHKLSSKNSIQSDSKSCWTTFHEQDGISISEYSNPDYPMDTLMASCHVEADPHEVRRLLTDSPEYVDGLLEQREVLCRLDNRTSVQWIAYGAMWPIGARDFLVLTSESTFNANNPFDEDVNAFHDSFILVSTSVDSMYEDIIESQSQSHGEEDEEAQYTRSYLRLAGYIGTKSKGRGGTDLRLFINLDIATYIPAWVLQILSQYGLSEMMNRIRTALSAEKISEFRNMTRLGNSSASRLHPRAPSRLNTIMAQIQDREQRLLSLASGQSASQSADEARLEGKKLPKQEDTNVLKGKKLVAESLRRLKIYAGIVDSKEHGDFSWQVRTRKGAIEVSTSAVQNSSWTALRATMTVPHADVDTLRAFLFDDSNLPSIDDMLDTIEPVLKIDDCAAIRHIKFKGIWPTTPRDFVLCTSWAEEELADNRKRAFVSSISAWPDLVPPQEGFVRASLTISGYVIDELEDCPNGSKLTMCAHSDLGGQLPSSIINALSVNAPIKVLTAISEVLRSKLKNA